MVRVSATPQFGLRDIQNVAHPLSFCDSSWDGKTSSAPHQVFGQAFPGLSQRIQNPELVQQIYSAVTRCTDLMHDGAFEPCPDTTSTSGRDLGPA
jgi:hypothetical protein